MNFHSFQHSHESGNHSRQGSGRTTATTDDAFSSLVDFGSSKKEKPLSLNEQQELKSQSRLKSVASNSSPNSWDFDLLAAKQSPVASPAKQPSQKSTLLDGFDDLLGDFSPTPSQKKVASTGSLLNPQTIPSQSDRPVSGASSDWTGVSLGEPDDDLHPFGEPVKPSSKPSIAPEPVKQSTANPSSFQDDEESEDELVARMANMGFPPGEAADALAANGYDIQAAVEQLLSSDRQFKDSSGNPPGSGVASLFDDPTTAFDPQTVKESATKIGLSVWNQANMAFKKSQQVVQTKVNEFQASGAAQGFLGKAESYLASAASTGKQVGMGLTSRAAGWATGRPARAGMGDYGYGQTQFYDGSDSDDEDMGSKPSYQRFEDSPDDDVSGGFQDEVVAPQKAKTSSRPIQKQSSRDADLLAYGDEPIHIERTTAAPASRTPVQQGMLKEPAVNRPPFPTASKPQLQQAQALREAGNAAFKLGQFDVALEKYSEAVKLLPTKHILTIPILNNRALSLSKAGRFNEAISDADSIISVFKHYGDIESAPMRDSSCGVEVSEADLAKAMMRKAVCLEESERYRDAKEVYDSSVCRRLLAQQAAEGARRCDGHLRPKASPAPRTGSQSSSNSGQNTPAPVKVTNAQDDFLAMFDSRAASSSSPQVLSVDSERVRKLREDQAAKDADSEAKFKCKDVVDAKISAWKDGKENNLRALLCTLQNVLWNDLNWQPLNMTNMVTAQKVKVSYMKAISKVHPDKVGSNLKVEHQLIAASVFSTLNKAWDVFKEQNGMS